MGFLLSQFADNFNRIKFHYVLKSSILSESKTGSSRSNDSPLILDRSKCKQTVIWRYVINGYY